mmetsp:Transcript_9444/g.13965  ORF Transcript_9444/g.13965 Transcript_9444/m.13965 type:complete len:84 (-) Transcript_9444:2491-2742(-)
MTNNNLNIDNIGEGVGTKRWETIREAWLKPTNGIENETNKYVDIDTVVEYLTDPKKPKFPSPVCLTEMVDILIEVWEREGLFE